MRSSRKDRLIEVISKGQVMLLVIDLLFVSDYVERLSSCTHDLLIDYNLLNDFSGIYLVFDFLIYLAVSNISRLLSSKPMFYVSSYPRILFLFELLFSW